MRVDEGASMKQILVFGCSLALALIVMDTNVVKTPSGLTVKGGQALAADLPAPPPPMAAPVVAPVGKGKAPIGKGKGKGPPPPVVTKG
jgi:hypothetical protein